MYTSPFEAWLDLVTLPLKIQQAMFADMITGTAQMSFATSLMGGTPRRRSNAQLTLVSSNNWVRSHKSTANLSVVSS